MLMRYLKIIVLERCRYELSFQGVCCLLTTAYLTAFHYVCLSCNCQKCSINTSNFLFLYSRYYTHESYWQNLLLQIIANVLQNNIPVIRLLLNNFHIFEIKYIIYKSKYRHITINKNQVVVFCNMILRDYVTR